VKTKVWLAIWGLKDGGAEVLAREYARLADPDRFETALITMYPFTGTANYQQAKDAGMNILSVFKTRSVFTRAVRVLLGRWYIPFALKRMLTQEQPDCIHFNSPIAYCFAPLKNRLSGIKLLYTCHSEVDKHFFEKEEAAVLQLIKNNGMRLIALHEDMRRELDQRFLTENTVVIRNGVDLRRFRETTLGADQVRESIGITQDAFVVGHIGRFSEPKNHMFLLQVFRTIAKRKNNAHLLLVGNGELQAQVMQEIVRLNLEDRVTVLSHRTDIPELLRAMDVMVFPSIYEGLSVTLVEAQASGLKCVISDTINPANILSEKTIPVSLNASLDEWADVALSNGPWNDNHGCIEDFDMNREICRLERLYQGELDV
jgi:glycosyltransferase involved in cell wall biosynthesis